MASRQMKMPEKTESELEDNFSQRKRPELGRYLLQVDRQTKGSYQTVETAQAAGHAIKKEYPILHVTIYDNIECTSTALAPPSVVISVGSGVRRSRESRNRAGARLELLTKTRRRP